MVQLGLSEGIVNICLVIVIGGRLWGSCVSPQKGEKYVSWGELDKEMISEIIIELTKSV